ncbi:membrane protein [Rhodopirellula maiorica SM1]|uniref:Membrane protein n=1 Tax=Rhodopirellula maiorica SM1 TaxID=1265738 RepID=M5S8P1_9BACT|nr:hypothetical protein [Rhodopirellula maiorica]EMI22544.1 membrane protein [Rhodopirellula maiorica SM1]
MTAPNPFDPPASTVEAIGDTSAPASTWLRNLKAMAAITITYSVISALFALTKSMMPEPFFILALVAISALASAWANLALGTRIGWTSGGLPVVMIVFFAALVAYCLIALTVGNMLYRMINPITIYSPYPASFPY